MAEDIEKVKYLIDYDFRDRELLRAALTHRSYSAENDLSYDNQRLEFLGDAVLEIVLTEYLYYLYPDSTEGDMTKMRSALAREEMLASLARKLDLGSFILLGRGEAENGGQNRDSTLADLFEALLGAWYLDAGLDRVRSFVVDMVREACPDPRKLLTSINPKGTLQELTQRVWGEAPQYTTVGSSGPEHSPSYEVEVTVRDRSARAVATSRKSAESRAAEAMLRQLEAEHLL